MSSPPVKPIDLAAVVPGGIWSTDHVQRPRLRRDLQPMPHADRR